MAKLMRRDVKHIADLAKLKLTKKEEDRFLKQLSKVVDYISELSEVNIDQIAPTSQTTGLTSVSSEDGADTTRCLRTVDVLSGTEKTYNGFFVVPRILEK